MRLFLYSLGPAQSYVASLFELERQGKVRLTFIMCRPFRQLALKLLSYLPFVTRSYSFVPTWSDLCMSLFAPVTLLFVKNIYVSFGPYDWRVWYLLVLKKLGKNIVYFHSWPYWDGRCIFASRFFSKWAFERFLTGVKAVTVLAEGEAGLRALGAKVVAIPHVVDFVPVPKKKHTGVRVLYVGRIEPQKGVLDTLHILEKIGDVTFVVIGEGRDAAKLVSDTISVEYHGFVSDRDKLAAIYASCDIFVLNSYKNPTWQEWYGMVLLEALASGLAIVAVDHMGPRTILDDAGLLFADADATALEQHLRELISSEKLRESYSKKSLERSKNFSLQKAANDWWDVLNG